MGASKAYIEWEIDGGEYADAEEFWCNMNIDLGKLQFTFQDKPLLIGVRAMEYYGIRETKNDIDFVISHADHKQLIKQYPDSLKDIFGDIGVIKFEFEIWNTIRTFDHEYLKEHAIEQPNYLVISIEKLLFLKTLAMYDDEKCRRDVKLIVDYISKKAYGGEFATAGDKS